MSKEMTPKEALQMIQDNLTPRVLGIFPVEFHIVKEALDRLEETNFNYHNALAFCEASKEEKQELYKQIKQLEKENQELLMAIENKNNEIKNLKKLICDNPYKKVIEILKDKVTFRWRNDDILEIVKYVWQNNSPRIEILTNYEEDELLKEVLE